MEFETFENDIIDTLDKKLDGLKIYNNNKVIELRTEYNEKISALHNKINELEAQVKDPLADLTTNNDDDNPEVGEPKPNVNKKIQQLINKVENLEGHQEEQIDRTLRSTLIFRNINFDPQTETDANKTIEL